MRVSDWNSIAEQDGEFRQYRDRTVGLLRKYLRMAGEAGRLPSLLGREFFRTAVTSYTTRTYEDAIVFVLDIERVLDALDGEAQGIVVRLFFQEYDYDEASALLAIPRRSFFRRAAEAIDRLSQLLLDRGLLDRAHQPVSSTTVKLLSRHDQIRPKFPVTGISNPKNLQSPPHPKFCQVSKIAKFTATL